MSIGKTDICNLALSHISQREITNVDDNTENSMNRQKCSRYYELALKSTLEAHDWNFAKKTLALSLYTTRTIQGDSDTTTGEYIPSWEYFYTYPSNCVKLRKLYQDGTTKNETERYEEMQTQLDVRVIATDIEDAYLDYTYYETSEAKYPPLFIEAFSYKLASMIAKPLTGDDNLGKTMLAIYQSIIDSARLSNKTQGKAILEEDNIFVKARG